MCVQRSYGNISTLLSNNCAKPRKAFQQKPFDAFSHELLPERKPTPRAPHGAELQQVRAAHGKRLPNGAGVVIPLRQASKDGARGGALGIIVHLENTLLLGRFGPGREDHICREDHPSSDGLPPTSANL